MIGFISSVDKTQRDDWAARAKPGVSRCTYLLGTLNVPSQCSYLTSCNHWHAHPGHLHRKGGAAMWRGGFESGSNSESVPVDIERGRDDNVMLS